jgi:hypothetical protein
MHRCSELNVAGFDRCNAYWLGSVVVRPFNHGVDPPRSGRRRGEPWGWAKSLKTRKNATMRRAHVTTAYFRKFLPAARSGFRSGFPHAGQANASWDTSLPQSGHFTSGIV